MRLPWLRQLVTLTLFVGAVVLVIPSNVLGDPFLGDNLDSDHFPGRVVVDGAWPGTPGGKGRGWDGGRGWISRSRFDSADDRFYGRVDYVLYRDLVPGKDLPVERGTLELWFQRYIGRTTDLLSDNLVEFIDADGQTLLTVAVTYPDGPEKPGLNIWPKVGIWGELVPMNPVGVGDWIHLALTWGPDGEEDNRVFLDGVDHTPPAAGQEDFAEVIKKARAFRLGLGWDRSDSAYHTLFDEFMFSGEIKRNFDLTRSLLAP